MRIAIKDHSDPVTVEALPCGVPGLAIHPDPDRPDLFVITHIRSGLSVALFADGEAALAAASGLGELLPGGWTLSGEDIADEISQGEVADVVSPWGGSFGWPAGDRSDIAAVTGG